MLSFVRFLAGITACAVVVGILAYGAVLVRRSVLPGWSGALARLAEIVIGLSVFFAVAQALGAVHVFSSVLVFVGELLGGLALCVAGRRLPATGAHQDDASVTSVRSSRPGGAEVAAAVVGVGLVVVQWSTHVAYALSKGMTHADTLWYHLPFAATFVQQHGFTGIDSVGYDAARWFPFNAQVVHAAGMLAFGRDIISPFVNLAWMALVLLAAWCVGERRGVGHVCVLGAGAALGLPIMAATQPGQASSDVACAALLLAAVAFLLESRFAPVPVALAGLAAGMALSTKITIAAPMALLAVGVVVVALRARRYAAAATWTGALALTGSFWFLRDWVLSGTPLPWFDINAGPIHLPAQIPPSAPSLAHDVLRADAWRDLYLDGIWQGLGRAWPVVLALLLVAVVLLVVSGPSGAHRLVGAVLVVGVVGYVFTPLTGGFGFVFNLRYLAPVLLVAFAVLPALLPSPAGWRRLAIAMLLVVLVADLTMPNRERVDAWPSGTILPAVIVLAVAAALAYLVVRRPRALVGASAALLAVVALWFAQRHYLEHRYVGVGLDADAVNVYFRDVHDARIVVFGSDETYPMFGLDLSNRVARGDVPVVDVHGDDCRGWRSNLRDRADYVVMTQFGFGYFVKPPDAVIADDPAAHVVLRAGNSTVYRIDGAFDPATC